MSIVSTATKKRMYELAEEILSEERQNREAEAKGYTRNPDSLCRLYDDADHEFRASRIKSLLDELNNVHQLADSYRHRIAELEGALNLAAASYAGERARADALQADFNKAESMITQYSNALSQAANDKAQWVVMETGFRQRIAQLERGNDAVEDK